jgi:hypothetical protein
MGNVLKEYQENIKPAKKKQRRFGVQRTAENYSYFFPFSKDLTYLLCIPCQKGVYFLRPFFDRLFYYSLYLY